MTQKKNHFYILTVLLAGALSAAGVGRVYAQVESDFTNAGALRMGWSGSLCNTSLAGALRYNSGSAAIEFCNGTSWGSSNASASMLNHLSDARATTQVISLGSNLPGLTGNGGAGRSTVSVGHLSMHQNQGLGNGEYVSFGYNVMPGFSYGTYGYNMGVGSNALKNQISGTNMIAVGARIVENSTADALNSFTIVGAEAAPYGQQHGYTCAGYRCLYTARQGGYQVALGYMAGGTATWANRMIALGANTKTSTPNINDEMNIGDLIKGRWAESNKRVGINKTDPAVALDVVGDIKYTGVMTDISDRRLKTNIAELPASLSDLERIRAVSFVMKDDKEQNKEFGFIAQELQKIYPDVVSVADDADQTLSVNYLGMIAPLVKSYQQLSEISESQKKRIAELEAQLQ